MRNNTNEPLNSVLQSMNFVDLFSFHFRYNSMIIEKPYYNTIIFIVGIYRFHMSSRLMINKEY